MMSLVDQIRKTEFCKVLDTLQNSVFEVLDKENLYFCFEYCITYLLRKRKPKEEETRLFEKFFLFLFVSLLLMMKNKNIDFVEILAKCVTPKNNEKNT